jgi:SAM-dependent methyltransferase
MAASALPPVHLANRVGQLVGADGSFAAYEAVGREIRDDVVAALPAGWSWPGKRVLDFGCGAGRTLRHFRAEAADAEFWGCDIDAASIAWMNANLHPPVRAFVNSELPPLPQQNGSFDLIYAFSVFTHITHSWSAWLQELHRLLAPGGLLVASFLGAGLSEALAGEPWDEDRVGMNVLRAHQDWDAGGPIVLMSPWWIREHWGRALEICGLRDDGIVGKHGMVVARPRPNAPTRAELERIDPRESREIAALQHNIRQLQRESDDANAALERAHAALARTVEEFEASRSWRLTAPFRWARTRIRH